MEDINNKWGLTVRGILKNEENKILLVKRHFKSRNEAKKWEIPGGKVDTGEFFEEALVREFKEETRLDIIIKGLYDAVETSFNKNNDIIKTVQIIMNVDFKNDLNNDIKLSSEHEDYKWLSLDEIKDFYNKNILTSTVKKALEKQEFKI